MKSEQAHLLIERNSSRGSPWKWLLVGAIAIVPLVARLLSYPDYPGSDDAFIHLQIVRNLTHGFGWGINVGQRVNLSTSPLFTLLLSSGTLAGFDTEGFGSAASCLASIIGLLILQRLLLWITGSFRLSLAGMAFGAFDIWLWRWNGSVMEATLAFCLVLLVCLMHYGEGLRTGFWPFISGIVLGMAILTRPEIVLLYFCLALDFLWNRRDRILEGVKLTVGVGIVISPWLIFSKLYFLRIIPTTYNAKASASLHFLNIDILSQLGSSILSGCGGLLLLLAAAVTKAIVDQTFRMQAFADARRYLALFLFPALLFSFYYFRTPSLESPGRYYLPALGLFPTMIIFLRHAPSGKWDLGSSRWLVGALVVQIAACGWLNETRIAPVLRGFRGNYLRAAKADADFLAERCAPTDVVLVKSDIGALSFFGRHRFIIADGGLLAAPELRGLDLQGMIFASRARFLVESLGRAPGAMGEDHPECRLTLLHSEEYKSHSTSSPKAELFCNVYSTLR